jgi:hypothetical protein
MAERKKTDGETLGMTDTKSQIDFDAPAGPSKMALTQQRAHKQLVGR